MGKKTIAEFVEDNDSFNVVASLAMDYCQSFYLGRPVTVDLNLPKLHTSLEQLKIHP